MHTDIYQERYLKHQQRKKELLTPIEEKRKIMHGRDCLQKLGELSVARKSYRTFSAEAIQEGEYINLMGLLDLVPSSCDRHAIETLKVIDKIEKNYISGIMVGGIGWMHRANLILLLNGHSEAYRENLPYMPYLDAGVMIQQAYLACEALNLKCCYVNPNTSDSDGIRLRFNIDIFCGALAIGK